jgi:methylated-DNA-[protein]-cysteine S-methyltransferase
MRDLATAERQTLSGRQFGSVLTLATPFGARLTLEANDDAIVACEFRQRVPISSGRPGHPILREASAQLRAYFAKRLRRFDLPLDLRGTALQVAVWQLVSQLETGELISYGDVARAVGSPGAHRGVAAAMGRSPYDLLIPAHRVIGADGKIKGAGPNSIRRRMLAFEGIKL